MTTLANVQSSIVRTISRSSLVLKKHSPEILLGLGLTGMIATAIMVGKASTKVNKLVGKTRAEVNAITYNSDRGFIGDDQKRNTYTKEEAKKDLASVYIKSGLEFARLYGPAVGIGVLSVASILSSHGIMKKREVGLIAGYNLLAEGFSAYRKRVVEELGSETDKNYRFGIYESEYNDKVTGEDGVVTKEKKKEKKIANKKVSGFAKFFDEYSTQWQKSAETNLYFLRLQQNYANDKLKAHGFVFLNEVYEMLGLPRTSEGAIYGWIMNGDGSTVIDFGIYNIDNPAGRAFVNGYEKAILLDFNITGIIWDQI